MRCHCCVALRLCPERLSTVIIVLCWNCADQGVRSKGRALSAQGSGPQALRLRKTGLNAGDMPGAAKQLCVALY